MSTGYGARSQNYEEYMKDHKYYEEHKQLKGRRTPKQLAKMVDSVNRVNKFKNYANDEKSAYVGNYQKNLKAKTRENRYKDLYDKINANKKFENTYSRQELKDKFGTDNLDIINAGREEPVRLNEAKYDVNKADVSFKSFLNNVVEGTNEGKNYIDWKKDQRNKFSEKQIEAGNRLNKNAEEGLRSDVKLFLSGSVDYDGTREDFARDLSNNWGVELDRANEILMEENAKHPRAFKSFSVSDNNFVDIPGFEGYKYNNSTGEIKAPDADYYRSKGYSESEIKDTLLFKTQEEQFTSQSTNPLYPDATYTNDEVKKMEENGTRPMKNTYGGRGWEGVNSDKNLSTSEQAKAITSAMKKKYPDVKISRKSDIYSGGSSIHFNVMSSDKDIYKTDTEIDNMSFEDLQKGGLHTNSWGFEKWAKENIPDYTGTYSIEDTRKYAKEQLAYYRGKENQSVSGNEWYLSDFGKELMSDLNKEANSYTYDDSDAMTDYFNHGTYMWVNIGKYDNPYKVNDKIEKYKKQKSTKV